MRFSGFFFIALWMANLHNSNMDLHTQITAKFETFRNYRMTIKKDRLDLTQDEFLRFIIKEGIVDRVLSRRKGLPIKRIDDMKAWSLDNIEPVNRTEYVKLTNRQLKPRLRGIVRPAARYGGEVLTVSEWIAELRQNASNN
ncbi:hypothetical protein J2Y48_002480 [Mycoplana sp. BE70]|uniref:hypothetical protein n=1 Tax=Mycoplana sp. BE70 TaxID=2817775 RepID=UPI00285790E1|nr:hypothetical protein [Mycoplana sp. BE70]MDR6757184.1 hypothetical protein [Mycoplana sp. BE70]